MRTNTTIGAKTAMYRLPATLMATARQTSRYGVLQMELSISRTPTETLRIFQFGIPTDKPMAADFDGDGMTDVGMFRNGTWYTLGSQAGFRVTQFGQAGDIPVPADYDGDGAADIAVFRAGRGTN